MTDLEGADLPRIKDLIPSYNARPALQWVRSTATIYQTNTYKLQCYT